MLSFFKKRAFLVALGLILAALFIWLAGPYFSFNEWYPLETELARIIAILLVVAIWGVLAFLKKLKARRTSDQLAAAVVKQSSEERPSADVVQLRERFEEAVKALKGKQRDGHSLYEMPWYLIIGAPGAGKTTALVNSGLHFPLEQRSGKGALRGVGGTRNCDWWFTEEAVFLDTAGRYTTQDSDATADSKGWAEFLGLLKKYRSRRPVNGVILAISAHDLMVQGHAGREAHVAAARRRLTELNKELRINLPVYVLVTKCDLVSGFMEYFDDVVQEGRTQVWGVTFPYDVTQNGTAAKSFPGEFDALMTRLNERVFARLEDDRDVRRRAKVFGFPQQMAALKETLDGFITDLFESTRFDHPLLLRGVYFTSGTQEGTPIDRLLGALGRRFSVPAEAVSTGSRGKAFFIERLLKDVMIAESGLAGVNRRIEFQKAAAQLGAYAALVLVAVIGIIGMSVSYGRNRAYINDVAGDVAGLKSAPAPTSVTSLDMLLPRLAAVESVVQSADRYRASVPWGMTWGLYQGTALGNAARDAYSRELDGALLEQVAARVRQRLAEYTGDPDRLFLYLKAYLMFDQPERLDKDHLGAIAAQEWATAYKNNPQAGEDLSRHFANLLEYKGRLRRIPADPELVEKARRTLPPDAIPRLIYSQIKIGYNADTANVVRLDGIGADKVFRRKSGAKLSQPISALYTKEGFNQVVSQDANDLERKFAADRWVWGEGRISPMDSARLKNAVMDLYESDYIATWDGVLNDIGLSASGGTAEAARVLRSLSSATSPLRELLKIVDRNTYLVSTDKPTSVIGKLEKQGADILKQGQKAVGINVATPGVRVTNYFAQIHQLMAGEPGKAPIDALLAQLQQLSDKLAPIDQIGGPDKVTALAQVSTMSERLKQDAADLPKSVGQIVAEAGSLAQAASRSGLGGDLSGKYQREVVDVCRGAIDGRYPFGAANLPDVLMADFGRVFGTGGTYDQFFKSNLEPLVDTSGATWAWRTDASGTAVGVPGAALPKFQQARQIRDTFFPPGALSPKVVFNVTFTSAGLDVWYSRSSLEVDGTLVTYSFGPEMPKEVTWPGPQTSGAAFILVPKKGPAPPPIAEKGPWALFRLIDRGKLVDGPRGTYDLEFLYDGRLTKIQLTPSGVQNPFTQRNRTLLSQFRCGG